MSPTLCYTAPQSASLVTQRSLTTVVLVFWSCHLCLPWNGSSCLFSQSLNQISAPPSPIQASLPPCACTYSIFCQESILLTQPASREGYSAFLFSASSSMKPSLPYQPSPGPGRRQPQGWNKTDLCGPMDMGVMSQPCRLQAGRAWSVTETPCLPFSVSNFHPLGIL